VHLKRSWILGVGGAFKGHQFAICTPRASVSAASCQSIALKLVEFVFLPHHSESISNRLGDCTSTLNLMGNAVSCSLSSGFGFTSGAFRWCAYLSVFHHHGCMGECWIYTLRHLWVQKDCRQLLRLDGCVTDCRLRSRRVTPESCLVTTAHAQAAQA
jgi:hypothetical protein